MFTQSQVMYSLSRKQANECSIRSTGTFVNYSIDTMSVLFFLGAPNFRGVRSKKHQT